MNKEAIVKNQYDETAKIYDERWHSYVSATLAFLKNWMWLNGDETILDVACGTGELERMLIAEHPAQKIIGVDISGKMLAEAQKKLAGFENVSFRESSASELLFPDQSFDIVVSANSFHYFENPQLFLREAHRVLKPDGALIILDWCRDYWICLVCDLFLKIFDSAHQVCYNQKELRELLAESNFDVEAEQRTRLQTVWGMMVAKAVKNKG